MIYDECTVCGATSFNGHAVCDSCVENDYGPKPEYQEYVFYPDAPYLTVESEKEQYINKRHEQRWFNTLAFFKNQDVNLLVWNRKHTAWHEASLPF